MKNLIIIILSVLLTISLALNVYLLSNKNNGSSDDAMELEQDSAVQEDNSTKEDSANILTEESIEEIDNNEVSIENVRTYVIRDITASLKEDGDGKAHYMLVSILLYMDATNSDYDKYGSEENIISYEDALKAKVLSVLSNYTLSEIREKEATAQEEILDELQSLFDSDFIYKIEFSSKIYQ